MFATNAEIEAFLSKIHPYDGLTSERLADVASQMVSVTTAQGELVYGVGEKLHGLYLIYQGQIEIREPGGSLISLLERRNSFGEKGLLGDGHAVTEAFAETGARLLMLPGATLDALIQEYLVFERFFDRRLLNTRVGWTIATIPVSKLMSRDLVVCDPTHTVSSVAEKMRDRNVSSVLVTEGDELVGIVTTRDLTTRVVAEGLPGKTPVTAIMTNNPMTLPPTALGSEVLHAMLEKRISHLPVSEKGKVVGILTHTDLTHYQAWTSASLIKDIARANDVEAVADAVGGIPRLLVQLVTSGNSHSTTTRLITDVGDAATRRLIEFAEVKLGPPPVPYLWLACGSQGRQEQTGVSDQDNCLFLNDTYTPEHESYFSELARLVSDGLAKCGYYYCPGDMMATNPKWRQPVHIWRKYFDDWIATPNPMAQMLASVMFDLRPISGTIELFESMITEPLNKAASNSIFVAHMVSNALKHSPPLNLFGGLATIRSGEQKDFVDLKLSGVVPIVDIARIYALQGRIDIANTGARLEAAGESQIMSESGGRDLVDAYDLIAQTRLRHQVDLIRESKAPDNFMSVKGISELERSHLRNAFVVVKTMQSALGQGRSVLS